MFHAKQIKEILTKKNNNEKINNSPNVITCYQC